MAIFDPGFQKSTHAISKAMNLNLMGKNKLPNIQKNKLLPCKNMSPGCYLGL
jgi:hypothetical protein